MKFLQIFTKTPNYKKFNYSPRFYNPEEEERKERVRRIELELDEERRKEIAAQKPPTDSIYGYRERMHGSFRQNRVQPGATPRSRDSSATMLRLLILLVLTVGLISYLQFGKVALYGLALIFIPLYLYSKFRNLSKKRQ